MISGIILGVLNWSTAFGYEMFSISYVLQLKDLTVFVVSFQRAAGVFVIVLLFCLSINFSVLSLSLRC